MVLGNSALATVLFRRHAAKLADQRRRVSGRESTVAPRGTRLSACVRWVVDATGADPQAAALRRLDDAPRGTVILQIDGAWTVA
jgi:hypothetical protein